VFFNNFEHKVQVGTQMLGPSGPLGFRGIQVLTSWPQVLIAVVLLCGVFAWIERSRIGLAATAIREDETAAACAGVNVVLVKVSMFVFGAFIAGIGGGLYATHASYIVAENFGFHLALISIFFVAVGGTERFQGPVLGAVFLTFLPEIFRFTGDLRMIFYAIAVIGIVVIFPRGLYDEVRLRISERRSVSKQRRAKRENARASPSEGTV